MVSSSRVFGLLPVEVGHTDTDATTMLHVPEIGLLVAGDVVYNGVHLYLTESGGVTGIEQWLAALDIAEALEPAAVIAGHKNPRASDNPSQIQATRRYLTDARELLTVFDSTQKGSTTACSPCTPTGSTLARYGVPR